MNEVASFWARRRAGVQAEAQAEERETVEAAERAQAEVLAEKDDEEILAELGLPIPSEMQHGDDFSAFMSKAVPEHLRRQALRTLWRSNPVLACVDGLNDYDDDFRTIGVLKEPIKTAYQVGKGMMYHLQEVERKAQLEAEDEPDAGVLVADAADEVTESTAVPEQGVSEPNVEAATITSEPEEHAALPRRMRFHFEEATA